jgi:Flp pilus assembly protein CpaB
MNKQTTVVFFAILAAFGLITVVAVDIVLDTQEAEAKGCRTSQAVNASKGRCIQD